MSCTEPLPRKFAFAFCTVLTSLAVTGASHAGTAESVLYSFKGGSDGANPQAVLLRDKAGNLYGTTVYGGVATCSFGSQPGCGTVFKLAPNNKKSVLYTFQGEADGALPLAGLIADKSGTLFGTTEAGGNFQCAHSGCGTVFEITSENKEKVLHAFTLLGDGGYPLAGLIADGAGVMYGTTYNGGTVFDCNESVGCGTAFKVGPGETESVIYSFAGGNNASYPQAGLIADGVGNFYGTTENGGGGNCVTNAQQGCGTVFKLTPRGVEAVLYAFKGGSDGYFPLAGLLIDSNGNLYGTTSQGGAANSGTIFKISARTETILLSFDGAAGGANPHAQLIADKRGNLYGTTIAGGTENEGVVFKLSPAGKESVLHSFGSGSDGASPYAGLIADRSGNFYGTTSTGGKNGFGTIYKLSPDVVTQAGKKSKPPKHP